MFKSFAFAMALVLAVIAGASDEALAQSTQQDRDDPNHTRLLFGPTGRSLRAGEVHAGVYELFLPNVQVGITDHLSIGGGTPLLFFGEIDRPYWVTPKLKLLQRGSTSASVGAMHFLNIDDQANIGIAYGVVTQGGAQSAVTVGGGYAYARWNLDDDRAESKAGAAVLMLGGEQRIARGVKLVTENYAFSGGGFISGGVRLFGDKLSADIGLMVPLFDGSRAVLPVVNVVRKF